MDGPTAVISILYSEVQLNHSLGLLALLVLPECHLAAALVAAGLVVRGRACVVVLGVHQGLEVPHLDHLAARGTTGDQRIHLHGVVSVLCEQFLNRLVVKQLFLAETEDLKGLLARHEAALNT